MTDYELKAKEFLAKCNATMEITFIGKERHPNWDEREARNKYKFVITTPLGTMTDFFWDSIYSTQKGIFEVCEYNIIACLERWDVGTIDDFVSEFGYEVHCWDDVKRIERTYQAVINQYNKLCEIFTPEQMEWIKEI